MSMPTHSTVADVAEVLERLAPLRLAADWDNVGLLLGDRRANVVRVLTCLTLTSAVAAEAIETDVQMVVTHHPLPFRPIDRITADASSGAILLSLAAAGIAVWSSHTAWDSAVGGINDQLATLLRLTDVEPLEPDTIDASAGFGRCGTPSDATTLGDLADSLSRKLRIRGALITGEKLRSVTRVAIACGSSGEAVVAAEAKACDVLVTGEIRLHAALDAMAAGVAVLAVGHHASERFALEQLAVVLAKAMPLIETKASDRDTDPFSWHAAFS